MKIFRRWLLVAAAATAVVVGVPIWTAVFWSPTDWGAVWGAAGQWVGGAGIVAAVWTALHIARREAAGADERALIEARDRETRALDASKERAVQAASLVLADMEYPGYQDGSDPEWFVRITNHGDQPVLLPRLENFVHPGLEGTTSWDVDDPAGRFDEYVAPGALPAGKSDRIPVRIHYDPLLSTQDQSQPGRPIPVFADLSGRRWRRVGTSMPTRVASNDSTEVSGPSWCRVAASEATQ